MGREPGDPQFLHPVSGAHDVQEGIQSPQFVEVHLLQGLAVNPGLHLPQEAEHGEAAFLYPGTQGAACDQGADLPVAPGGLGAAKPEVHLELHPAEMVLGAARRRQTHLGQPQ